MTRLSRPYQVALAAVGLLAAVWLVALRGHSGTSGGGASTPAPQPVTPSTPYHGSAPGVAGLTRAIEKARGAVAQSEANAKQLAEKSAQASSPSASGTKAGSTAGSRSTAESRSSAASRATSTPAPRSSARTHASRGGSAPSRRASAPTKQTLVEAELKQGKTVMVLFWDPKGIDDIAVRRELRALQASRGNSGPPHGRRIVLHDALAGEVGSFGSFTRAVQVYATPTILIILPSGKTKTLTGLADVYSIRQAISEALAA